MLRGVLLAIAFAFASAGGDTAASAQSYPYSFWPITDAERESHAEWLMMSEAQEAALVIIHRDYEERWQESHEELWAEKTEAIERFNHAYHEGSKAATLEELPSVYAAAKIAFEVNDRLWPKLTALDESYFAAILPLLADEQLERMPRVRNGRLRTIHAPTRIELPEASVDPFTLIESPHRAAEAQLQGRSPDSKKLVATENEWKSLEPVMSGREPQYARALVRVARARQKAAMDNFLQMDLGRELRLGSHEPEVRDVLERDRAEIRAARKKMIANEAKHLETVTRQVLHTFMAVLTPSRGDELERLFLEKAYPKVLPDSTHAAPLYEAAIQIESLSSEQRDAIKLTLEVYRRLHDDATQKMIDCVRKRRLIQIERVNDAAIVAEWERLADLGEERLRLNADQRRKIAMYLEPDQVAQLPAWDFEKNPPPKPWDRSGR